MHIKAAPCPLRYGKLAGDAIETIGPLVGCGSDVDNGPQTDRMRARSRTEWRTVCRIRSTKFPPSGPSAPSSRRPNTRKCTQARWPIPTAFGPSRASASTGSKPFTKVKNTSFAKGNVSIKWFEDGTTNVAYNCIDRHLHTRGDQTAIIWEGDDPEDSKHITYEQLHDEVCRFANVLSNRNVKKGDRVTIYLPMIPEAAYAMLACARIGAIHSVVFGGFSPDSLAGRIEDCQSKVVITADEGLRGGRKVPLKANTDAAIAKAGGIVEHVIVVKRTGAPVDWIRPRRLVPRGRATWSRRNVRAPR